MNGDAAEEMLTALGELLERERFGSVDLLVCGGMALVLQRFSDRPTRDIDSLGMVVEQDGTLELRKPSFGADLRLAIERVGTVFGRGKNWLNTGPVSLHDTDLPEGLIERAEVRRYGKVLTIRLCSREDMVLLKLWAACLRSGPDMDDLVEMGATEGEVDRGYWWCIGQGAEKETLIMILKEIGHAELAGRVGDKDK
jgi:hypothetical protein